jgi:uncharacterized protein YcgI (DUF1989 family)
VLPASGYMATTMKMSQVLRITDIMGMQVADLIAYALDNLEEAFWITNTIRLNKTVFVTTGHTLYSELSRPMLTITEDTCGMHDMLAGSCNAQIDGYRWHVDGHRGCAENLTDALAPWGKKRSEIPNSLNVFMNCPVREDGSWEVATPTSKPGDYVDFRADMDLLIAISNCPQDLNRCNGGALKPLGVTIYEPENPSDLKPYMAPWPRFEPDNQ